MVTDESVEERPYGFIYITENTANGKRYIGQRKIQGNRSDETYLGSGYALVNSIKKYGRDAFWRRIISVHDSKDELNQAEIELIARLGARKSDRFYNIGSGGGSESAGTKHSEEHKKKIGDAIRGRRMPISMGDKHRDLRLGIKASLETIAKNGGPRSPEIVSSMLAAVTWRRPIRCIETGQIFDSCIAASEWVGCAKTLINNCLSPTMRNKSARGFTFEYVERSGRFIRCVETGERFAGARELAESVGRSISVVYLHLQGKTSHIKLRSYQWVVV